jgi:hypothetical protein
MRSPRTGSSTNGQLYFGIEVSYRQPYFSKSIKFDPGTMAQFFAYVGQTVATEDIMAMRTSWRYSTAAAQSGGAAGPPRASSEP